MPESLHDIHATASSEIAAHSYRDSNWSQWMSWLFDGALSLRPLAAPSLPEPWAELPL